MKKSIILICMLALCFFANAQKAKDVLYLKNGSIIQGRVTDYTLSSVTIKTKDGSVFVYPTSEVQKMKRWKIKNDTLDEAAKMYMGFTASPTMPLASFKKYTQFEYYSAMPPYVPYYDVQQQFPLAGFRGGFTFKYMKRQVGFETGLWYSTSGLKTSYGETYQPPILQNNIDVYSWRYHCIEIPILFDVASKGKKVRFIGAFGISEAFTLFINDKDNGVKGFYSVLKGSNSPYGIASNNRYYFYDLLRPQMKLGVETTIGSNMILSVSPEAYWSLYEYFSGGFSMQLLFGVPGKRK